MISFRFKGARRFKAFVDRKRMRNWLRIVKDEAQAVFTAGLKGPHSGRVYSRRGRRHQASAPGEYPANDTGNLLASLKGQVTANTATIGTNVFYSKFLREGTRKMARRKMSDNALSEGVDEARPKLKGWVAWSRQR